MQAAQPYGGKGYALLLAHCCALSRLDAAKPSPFQRLAEEVGDDLARLLVTSLAPRAARRVA